MPDPPPAKTPCCDTGEKSKPDYLFLISLVGVLGLWVIGMFYRDSLSESGRLMTMVDTVHHMLGAMWWGVLAGALFIGVLSKIPREFIMSLLGQGGTMTGLFRAAGAGVLLDLCSHGILMVGAKLYERGASAGQIIAFLLASPWNSLSLTLVLIGLIGVKWTLLFIVLSMVVALITGWLFDRLVNRGVLPSNPNATSLSSDFRFWPEARKRLASTRFDGAFFKSRAHS